MDKRSSEQLKTLLQNEFSDKWSYLAHNLSFQKNGLNSFRTWCESQSWGAQLSLSKEETNDIFPLFLLYSFIQIRHRMISLGTYSFRKKSIEPYIVKSMNESNHSFLLHTYSNWTKLLLEDKNTVKQFCPQLFNLKETRNDDELKTKTAVDEWLLHWVSRPHIEKYINQYEKTKNEQLRVHFKNQAILILKERIFLESTRRVFIQLLAYHKCSYESINYFLLHVHDPLKLCIHGEQLLSFIKSEHPESTVKVLIQFIERLVEHKTRSHYTKAIEYLNELQQLFQTLGKSEQFYSVINLLKGRYSRYHSLQKELIRFES
ncbi:hypothetical protein [Evansella halocellulosilytica]|uniref:hypothetical protein n=1 Tax=Evansella halocellulosilytica TaxID=2011013 RepID=UPI000BB6F6EA|nr:hypothetical protein [Evansella halocellulosilytica]